MLLSKFSAKDLNSRTFLCFRYSRYRNLQLPFIVRSYRQTDKCQNQVDFLYREPSDYSNLYTSGWMSAQHRQVYNHPSRRNLCHSPYSQEVLGSENYQFLHSSNLQHWFKNWHELRKHKLTASTFGGAVGFWRRRRVQLWFEKVGLIEPFHGNLATCWSNIKEEVALERYKLITGNSVCFPEFQVYNKTNPDDDWLAASPDGVVDHVPYGLPYGGVLEVKCPFFSGELKNAFPWSRIPLYCIPQAQGLMEILDRDWMDFYVWTPNGSSLFRLHRNRQYWELLRSALSDFWCNHVQPAKELLGRDPRLDQIALINHLKPKPRHELCPTIVRASKYLVDDSTLLLQEIHGKLRN